MEQSILKLTPVQASAYWCVNMMRNKVREINQYSSANDQECDFLDIFYGYGDVEWRNIYIELSNHFEEIVEEMNGYEFSIDTGAGGHNKLNQVLSLILKQSIPDISLSGYSSKDSVVYVTKDKASVWYKSCGEMPLSLKYETDYVLTGNEDELELYSTLVATMAMLGVLDSGFRSTAELRGRFCKEFKKVNGLEDSLENITERFNLAYKKANERGLVTGNVYSTSFYPLIGSADIAALEDYMDKGHHYADVVLQREEVFPLPVDNKLKKDN